MGILIELADQDYQYCLDYANGKTNIFALSNTSRVIKAVANGMPYENQLKADMVAMLTEIQLEIEELDSRAGYDGGGMPTFSTDYIRKKKVYELIQQKINALKEEIT